MPDDPKEAAAEKSALKPETAPKAAAATEAEVRDDARFAAAGIRVAARWIAAALAGIPTLALVTTLLKPPEAGTFDASLLAGGVILATLGVLFGILALARVFEPVALEDADIQDPILRRIPEAVDANYDALVERIQRVHQEASDAHIRLRLAEARREAETARLAVAAEHAKAAEEALVKNPTDPGVGEFAAQARAALQAATARKADKAAGAAALTRAADHAERVLNASVSIRRVAFALAAGDVLRQRYERALSYLFVAALAVALGVACILAAPLEAEDDAKDAETASPLDPLAFITLELNARGRRAICDTETINALRLTKDAKAPTVLTLPQPNCPSKRVKFVLSPPAPLGTIAAD